MRLEQFIQLHMASTAARLLVRTGTPLLVYTVLFTLSRTATLLLLGFGGLAFDYVQGKLAEKTQRVNDNSLLN